jgi:hypothetical protein
MPNVIPIDQPQPSKRRANFAEVGRTGLRRYGGYVQEEFLRNLQGTQGVAVYREMKDNDDIVGACLFSFEQAIRKASWFIDPGEEDQEGKKAAEFLKGCMDDMSHTWSDFITEVCSFLPYGWAYHELVYKIRKGPSEDPTRNSKYSDGLIGWRKLPLRMQSSLFEWVFDSTGGIQAFRQAPPPDYDVLEVPISKAILFRTKVEGNNPEGYSILRHAYRSWFFKKVIQEVEAIGVERDLVGLPVFTAPEDFDIDSDENSDVRAYVDQLIASLRRDEQEGILLPPGWELKLLTVGNSRRQFDVNIIINRYDKRIAMTMLCQFLMLGMERVGSFALSKTDSDLFLVAAQSYLDSIADILNRFAVPKLFALNPSFANIKPDKLPKFVPGKISEPNLKEVADYINKIAQVQGLLDIDDGLKRDIRRIGGFQESEERSLGAAVNKPGQGKIIPATVVAPGGFGAGAAGAAPGSVSSKPPGSKPPSNQPPKK